ncbi:DUF402 domain-containing protein [Spiroplasma endosymbiont of Anurida maritima]|uniref:DUF402 domain-containing protein n=1 Tax=Spiroplasma endosymbiont of Anurida maritima TaxID=2967972 RepID=UPI0036D2A39E
MQEYKIGQQVLIHAYKHDGTLYRSWEYAEVYDITDTHLILVNKNVTITEINGRKWQAVEPALWIFSRGGWHNIICMLKGNGVQYYCNIASPYVIEQNTLKYIDYDLDIKVFSNGSYKILDLKEFNRNRLKMKYTQEITEIVWNEIDSLKNRIKNKSDFFDTKYIEKLYKKYNDKLLQFKKNKKWVEKNK